MAQTFLEQVTFIPSEFILNNAASTCFNDERVMSFGFAVTNVRVHVLYFLIFFYRILFRTVSSIRMIIFDYNLPLPRPIDKCAQGL